MKEVTKTWGSEIWIVNEPEYCGKFLCVKQGASGSLHSHKVKKETFLVKEGTVKLELILTNTGPPITIPPTLCHRFTGVTDCTLIEFSTHHDDEDTYRLEESRCS